MKKFTTQITKNNKTMTISVLVDNQTAKVLEKLDEKVRHDYIVSEHQIDLNERKETRYKQSLDVSLDNGHEFESDEPSMEDNLIKKEEYKKLHKAISYLSKEQQWLVYEVFFKCRSQVEIARELGIDPTSIRDRLKKIYEKIKKLCI